MRCLVGRASSKSEVGRGFFRGEASAAGAHQRTGAGGPWLWLNPGAVGFAAGRLYGSFLSCQV